MKNELTTLPTTTVLGIGIPPSEHEMQAITAMAKQAVASGVYKCSSLPEMMMKMLAGRELGVPPMLSAKAIHVVKGNIELSATLMNNLIRRAGHSMRVAESTAAVCTIVGRRSDNGDEMSVTFTMEQAQRAGLTRNPTWQSYPEDMLWSRALSRLARRLFADVIGNAYVEGEVSDIIPVEVEERMQLTGQAAIAAAPGNEDARLAAFVEQYAPEERAQRCSYLKSLSERCKTSLAAILDRAANNLDAFEASYQKSQSSAA